MADIVAICARLSEDSHARFGLPLEGSEIRPCFDCGSLIVLSPSTVQEEPRWAICHECGRGLIDNHPELILAPTTEAVRDYMALQERRRG